MGSEVGSEPWEERERAALRLGAAPGGKEALLAALADPHPLVRAAALDGLDRWLAQEDAEPLRRALGAAESPVDRARLVSLLGVLGAVDVGEARARLELAAPEEREALLLAMAREGDVVARRWFVARLRASADVELAYALRDVGILARRPPGAPLDVDPVSWVLAALSRLVRDERILAYLGDMVRPGEPETLRVCDAAVRLVAHVAERRFSFDPAAKRWLPAAALDEVARFLAPFAEEHAALLRGG